MNAHLPKRNSLAHKKGTTTRLWSNPTKVDAKVLTSCLTVDLLPQVTRATKVLIKHKLLKEYTF